MASPANRTLFLPGSPFSNLADQIEARRAEGLEIIPLHVGDTYRTPPVGPEAAAGPGVNRYTAPTGDAGFVAALEARVGRRIFLTAGATGGVSVAIQSVLMPHQEILVLAPYWPLVKGICRVASVSMTEVESYGDEDQLRASLKEIERRLKSHGVGALYISSPSNPTGRVLPPWYIAECAGLCDKYDRWLISDETYEDYVYVGRHFSPREVGRNVITCHSFSKSRGLAGYRLGYITGPPEVLEVARKIATHLWYSVPTASQRVGHASLEVEDWIPKARAEYRKTGREAAKLLELPEPEGSQFLWMPVSGDPAAFVAGALERGVLVTPGSAFGQKHAGYVRISYTAAPPDKVIEAVRSLALLR